MGAIAALALILGAGVSSAAGLTYVTTGTGPEHLVVRPTHFLAGTGRGGGILDLRHIHWKTWRASSAFGTGTITRACTHLCAPGQRFEPLPVKIKLTRPVRRCQIRSGGKPAPVAVFTHIGLWIPNGHFASTWGSFLVADTQNCQ